jgi:hypothetical protein
MSFPACHFCNGDHAFDDEGALECEPKRRYKGAFDSALAESAPGHEAGHDCPGCWNQRSRSLLGKVMFLGERPDQDFVIALLRRHAAGGLF